MINSIAGIMIHISVPQGCCGWPAGTAGAPVPAAGCCGAPAGAGLSEVVVGCCGSAVKAMGTWKVARIRKVGLALGGEAV
jgi:hypothetical protein